MIKLMVIDDEKNICDFVGEFFKDVGYQVTAVTDPLKALPLIQQEKPHVILLDINMPGIKGLPLLKKIREVNKETKVIMVTIVNDPQTRQEAESLGANAFVSKPFTTEYLEDVVIAKIEELFPLGGQASEEN